MDYNVKFSLFSRFACLYSEIFSPVMPLIIPIEVKSG